MNFLSLLCFLLILPLKVSLRLPLKSSAASLGAQPEPNFITIKGDAGQEKLPVSFASRFPVWVVEKTEEGQSVLTAVPHSSSEQTGWVDPLSFSDVWVSADSPPPRMTLSLGMLVKDGTPRYLLPALDVFVSKRGKLWRNRGIHSIPVAHCWLQVGASQLDRLALSAYAGERVEGSERASMWYTLEEKIGISEALTAIVGALADPPEGSALEEGFHFVVAQVPGTMNGPLPSDGGRVRVFLTDYEEPAKLLEVQETDMAELSAAITQVASASESEYLPEVYKELYQDR
ncbi:unnamed protein product [Discosporangium mesarthrocarpum]